MFVFDGIPGILGLWFTGILHSEQILSSLFEQYCTALPFFLFTRVTRFFFSVIGSVSENLEGCLFRVVYFELIHFEQRFFIGNGIT